MDGHEKKDMIWYRWKFIDCYLIIERCIFRWIQTAADESEQYKGYEKEKAVPVLGKRYKGCKPNEDSNDVADLAEYHVDTLPQFQDIVEKVARKEIL